MPSARLAAKHQRLVQAQRQRGYAAAITAAAHRTPQAVLSNPMGAYDTISPVPEQRCGASSAAPKVRQQTKSTDSIRLPGSRRAGIQELIASQASTIQARNACT